MFEYTPEPLLKRPTQSNIEYCNRKGKGAKAFLLQSDLIGKKGWKEEK